ncbi:hypothetical protein Y032_0164g3526 [Ancylostoma ceylanicum]|nr:hypothetical protein Y032_0164g3526 [Ancylostoma ceylanicum]
MLEYLVAEVVEVVGNAAMDESERSIELRHICMAPNFYSKLNKLVNEAVFSEGGLVPTSVLFENNIIRL